MNHFDDRTSYFAHLNDQREYVKCLNTNKQTDQSLAAYGGTPGIVTVADMKVDI